MIPRTRQQTIYYDVQLTFQAYRKSQKHTFPKQMYSSKYQTKITFQQKKSLEFSKIPALRTIMQEKVSKIHHKLQLLPWVKPITSMHGWQCEKQRLFDYFHLFHVTNSSAFQIKWNKVFQCIWCNKVMLLPPFRPDEAIRKQHFFLCSCYCCFFWSKLFMCSQCL